MAFSSKDLPSSQEYQHQHQHQRGQPQEQQQEEDDDDDRTTKHIVSFFNKWKDRLQECEINYTNKKENLEENDTVHYENKDNNSQWQKQYKIDTDYQLEIYQLEQQLHQIHQLLYYGNHHHHHDHDHPNPNPNPNRSTVRCEYHQSIIMNEIIPPLNHIITTHHIDIILTTLISIPTLQDELMKCQDMLKKKKVHTSRMMNSNTDKTHSHTNGLRNGPFLFYKYRLLQQQQQQQQQQQSTKNRPLLQESSSIPSLLQPNVTSPINKDELLHHTNTTTTTTTTSNCRSTTTCKKGMDPMSSSSMIIENLTNRTIIVDKDGNVQRQPPRIENEIIQQPTQYDSNGNYILSMKDDCISSSQSYCCNNNINITKPKIIYQSMMMRNLHNCSIQLLGNYKSIYFVNVEHTKINVCNPIQGAVHVTDCQQVSFIHGLQAQQLRLHNSFHIHCYNAIISAGTILEDCKDIIFYVPSTTTLSNAHNNNIKDFNWLRNGMASPNFSIQIYDPTITTMMTYNNSLIDPVLNNQRKDHHTVELPDQPSSSLPNDNNNNDDDNSDDDEI